MNFLTWEMMGSTAGVLAAVLIVTELVKNIPLLKRVPTQLVSWVLAMSIIVARDVMTGGAAWDDILLAVVNAAMVSLAANGGYDAVKRITGEKNEP